MQRVCDSKFQNFLPSLRQEGQRNRNGEGQKGERGVTEGQRETEKLSRIVPRSRIMSKREGREGDALCRGVSGEGRNLEEDRRDRERLGEIKGTL